MTKPDLSVSIGNLKLKNPVTTASGTYGQGEVFEPFYDINILGALTTKSVTVKPRPGNPPPRIAETRSGILNAIGLQNPGIDEFIRKYGERFEKLSTPLIVSIAGNTVEEYGLLAKRVSGELPAKAIEINISCPNVKQGGIQFAGSRTASAAVVKEVRANTNLVVITKLSPTCEDNVEIAKACINEGSDAIAVINTLKGVAIDLERRVPFLGNITGGLSGPAVKPVALRWVYELSRSIDKPIIGMGGISNAQDALEFIVTGAHAVAVGTANFSNPGIIPEIIKGMEDWLASHGYQSIAEIRKSLNELKY